MALFTQEVDVAGELCRELIAADFGPFFGTPCRVLLPLHAALDREAGVLTVAREDHAVGIATGASLSGRFPVVLMPDSGLGSSVNAIASLVLPHRIPLLFVVGLFARNTAHPTQSWMPQWPTRKLLDDLGVEPVELEPDTSHAAQVGLLRDAVQTGRRPAALLVPLVAFGLPA